MQDTGHGQQDRRGRPSPFGRSRLTTSATSQAPGHNRARITDDIAHRGPSTLGDAVAARRSGPEDATLEDASAAAPEDLMELVCQGNPQAFARLYDRFASQALGLALRVCGDRTVAEDAVQEAFLALWRKPAAYRPDRGSVPSYLLTLVHHRAVDAVRQEQRLRMRERESAVVQQPQTGDELVEAASASGLRDRVRAALAQLTHRQRQALELAYFSGLTVSDVAKRLDIPLGTAKTRVRDGMIRLRSLLAAEGEIG